MGPSVEKTLSRPNRPSRTTTQWLFRPYWKRVRFQLGDRVHVSSSPRASPGKYASGRLRFWGKIHCAAGYWAGIELELPHGQNDGSLHGHRYFLCHPNRGLFVRITRCRTRAGHGTSHARHVSFSTRTPGENADRDTWNAKPSRVTTSNNASVHRAKGGPSKPCRSEVYRRRSNAGTSNGTLPPSCREEPRADVRLNAVRWVPVGQSRPGHNQARRARFSAQSETNPLERASLRASLSMSEGSSSSASSESSASDGDSPEIDLNQVLEEILAPTSKIAGVIAVPPASEASKSDSGTPSAEALKAERRRQMLINSYSHWARTRDRHRRREQGRTSGGTKRAAMIEDHEKEAAPSTRTLVLAPNNQARTVWRNVRTEPDHPKRDGGIDGARRDVLSLRAASRQFLLSRSLRRARIFVTAGRFDDIPRGPNLIRADLPHGQAELSSACRSTRYGLVIPHAASVEIRTPTDGTEVTESTLALTTEVAGRTDGMVVSPPSFATGVEAVLPTEPRGGLLQTAQRPDRHAQRRKAPSQRLPAATTAEWRENGYRGPKSCGKWPSHVNVPISRPVVGFDRCPTSTPSSEKVVDVRSGVKAGISGGARGEHSHGLPYWDIVVWTQAMGVEGINVERRVRRAGPTEPVLREGRPASSWNAPHFTDPNRAKKVESRGVPAGEMVVSLLPRRRSMIAGDEPKIHSSSSGPLTKAAAVIERAFTRRYAQNDTERQHRVVPYLEKERASSLSKEHSPGGTVAIFCPAGALSTPPALGALQLQKQVVSGSDGGGFGGVPPLARREKHTKVYDANALQADRGMEMVSGGSRSLPHMPAVKGDTASALCLRSDDEDVRGEDRIARYCTAQFAVNTTPCGRTPHCQADPVERVGRRGRRRGAGMHLAPAALEKDNRRQWEPSKSSHASTPAVTCSQAPCPVGASSAAGDLNPPVPGGSIASETNGTSPVDLIRHETMEPARRAHVPESREGRIRSVERGRSRAEKPSWSRTAPFLTQAREDVRGKHHDTSSERELVEPSSSGRGGPARAEGHSLPPTAGTFGQLGKRSACGNPQLESGLLALSDRGEDGLKPHGSDGQGVSKASRAEALRLDGTPPAVPEQLEAHPAKQLSTLSSPAGLGVPSLSSRLPLPPSPCRPSPPLVGESGVPDNERDIPELAEDGPGAPVLPVDRMVQESLNITSPATCPLGRLSSFPLPLSPPALRSVGRSSLCGLCPAEKLDDDARGPSAPRAAWQLWAERWRQGSCGKDNDLDQGWTKCVSTPMTTSSGHKRSEPAEASAEAVPIVSDLGRKARSTEGNHDLTSKHWRSSLENRQHRVDSTANLQGHEESRAQWSEHSDSSKRAGRESRQRRRQRYPPPPGPPPSPTPAVGRGKTCSTWNNRSSSSQRRCKLSLEKQGGRTRANVGAAKLGTPTHDLTVDHELFKSSPRSFDVEGRSAPTDSEEYTAIQDLAEVAVDWLPPPTPPPPEARRRRQRPAGPPPSPASPQPTPATRACFPQTPSSPPPPPSPPSPAASPPHKRVSITGGEEQHGPRGKSTRHERGHRSPVSKDSGVLIGRRCKSTESENKTPVEKGGSDNDMNLAAITIRSAGEGVTGDKAEEGSTSSRRESWCRRGRGKRGATAGAWADSYEGSVAKRRADIILARIAALESYFDRVEEQALATPPSSLARGAAATEGQARTTREDSARAGDVRSDGTEGATFTDGVKPTLKAGMKVTTKGEQDAPLVNDDNPHLTFYPGDQRPSAASPLAQEAQGWSRTEKLSIEEGHADPGAVAGLNGPPSSLDQGIAISSAIYSSGQVPEGHGEDRRESDGAGGDLSREPQSRFYFNLGRNMVLGDFEWDSTASGSVVASLTGSACGR